MREIIFQAEDEGLEFRWNHSHTVNVRVLGGPPQDVDMFSVGDFALSGATLEEVEEAIEDYLSSVRADREEDY